MSRSPSRAVVLAECQDSKNQIHKSSQVLCIRCSLENSPIDDNETPEEQKYLYGTHYSCPGYVIGFLVRQYPQWMIKFQGGKFDNPNRLFKGINKEWKSVNTNPGNVKELIPEFYLENPEFLLNK